MEGRPSFDNAYIPCCQIRLRHLLDKFFCLSIFLLRFINLFLFYIPKG